MAWEERRGVDDDLMGVHGDVLFADPLGVRKDKAKPQSTPPNRSRNNGPPRAPAVARGQVDDSTSSRDRLDLDLNLPEHRNAEIRNGKDALIEEEEPGPVRAWLGHIFGVGSQCCSMRDRSKDAELAKKAAETGRPPAPTPKPESKEFPGPTKAEPKVDRVAPNKFDSDFDSRRQEDLSLHRPNPPKEEPLGSGTSGMRNLGGGLDALHSFAANEPPAGNRAPQPEARKEPPPRIDPAREQQIGDQALTREKPPPGQLPRKWQWPPWTLNTKEACIEVFVTDEDSGESTWCEAEPQFRVVDKEGNDAYLCAEYKWDGEFYVQDFGPHHVRKRGNDETVFQLFAFDPDAADDALKDTNKSMRGRKTIDDTDPFMTTKPRNDTGGGVSSWLEN
jgi:hypothetical protein